MKGSKELRKLCKTLVQNYGKKNGVVKSVFFDLPHIERKIAKNKHINLKNDKSWKYSFE